MTDHISDDFIIKKTINRMAHNARRNVWMWYGYYLKYLEYRFVRQNFRSWIYFGYYDVFKSR